MEFCSVHGFTRPCLFCDKPRNSEFIRLDPLVAPFQSTEDIERVHREERQRLIIAGRAHWLEIHSTRRPTRKWFRSWFDRIPNFGCSCQRDFTEILTRIRYRDWIDWIPAAPDAIVYTNFFEFGVSCHNAVNSKLGGAVAGKPIVSVEDAKLIWDR